MERKKLIEFGWDEPDPAFLRQQLAQVQASPFDGCVFHLPQGLTWVGWGTRVFTETELAPALADLRATRFGRFSQNFLRFNTTPGKLDWFDDHSAVLANARAVAKLAKDARLPGLLFDIEQYEGKLFHYPSQRDKESKSWEVYAAQVRRRGKEVMEAFQDGYPGLKVFLTFGYCLPWAQTQRKKQHLAEVEYGLLAPFVDGLVDGIEGKTRLIDGNELAYGYATPERIVAGAKLVRHDVLSIVADPKKYARVLSLSFGLWMDFNWREQGWNVDDPEKNPRPPALLEALTRTALAHADEYVWIYTETPRWWGATGPVKLPTAYDTALRRART